MKLASLLFAIAALAFFATPTALSLAPAASAHFGTFWKTPGEAAYCRLLAAPVRVTCWTPNDGFTITLYTTRRPEVFYYPGHRDYYRAVGLLPFNAGVDYNVISCWSRRTGLTCTNAASHGFWLGRYHGFRIF